MLRSRSARSLSTLLLSVLLWACGEEPASAPATPPAASGPLRLVRTEDRIDYERVVLVTLDTLRADHVSSYGYPRATTPFLDSLAARGVRFSRVLAAVSHTAPSHATMLTGLVPAVHGVVENGGTLAPGLEDLAGLFGQSGFESAAFLNVKFLSGIAASFGTVEVRALGPEQRLLSGADVVDAALGWLEHRRASPRFLLWVHLYDPHKWKDVVLEHEGRPEPIWQGASPPDFLSKVAALHGLPAPRAGEPYRVDWHVEKKGGETLDVASAAGFLRCIDAYDERTLFADRQVQRLYERIEALALPGRTLWVVTADHGEGLASHGVAGHGGRIYQEQLRVPLVVHASDGSLAPRVVDELVAHVDLFPTLAETLGVTVTGAAPLYEGRSLWPLLTGTSKGFAPRTLFAQRRPAESAEDPDQSRVFALQDGRHKLILHEPGESELFDLESDPLEAQNLGLAHPAAAALKRELDARLHLFDTLASEPGAEMPADWLEELRALGYVR
jgi:arylsulfatase A-like enzyme